MGVDGSWREWGHRRTVEADECIMMLSFDIKFEILL